MIMTVGQRIKAFRKEKDFSQSEIAEKVGVSVQTVSKWECDAGMPDISQIVPLAKVLETSTDAILGMIGDEEEDLAKTMHEINEIRTGARNNQSFGNRDCDKSLRCFEVLEAFVNKYPLNYLMLIRAALYGISVMRSATRGMFPEMSEKKKNGIYSKTERFLRTVVTYCPNIGFKKDAKIDLMELYSATGEFDKAYNECNDLGHDDQVYAKYRIAMAAGNCDDRLEYAKEFFEHTANHMMTGFYCLTGAHSVFGEDNRDNAIAVFEKMAEFCDYAMEFCPVEMLYHKRYPLYCIAKEYLRRGDFESCVKTAEHLADVCVEYYKAYTETGMAVNENFFNHSNFKGSRIETPEELKEALLWDMIKCYDECADKEGNPVVTDPRFIAARKKIEEL